MTAYIKKYWLFILLALTATILAFFWLTKPEPKPKENIPQVKITKPLIPGVPLGKSNQVVIQAKLPQQTEVSTLTYTKRNPYQSTEMEQIAKKMGFEGTPLVNQDINAGEVRAWNQSENYLTIDQNTNEITIGR